MLSWIFTFLLFVFLTPLASAQFNFFDMFGHGQQQQRHGGSPSSQWAAHADSVQCSDYLCPETLVCVTNPADCPCPNVEDEKCLIPDARDRDSATVVCVRGSEGCAEVERLASKWK
ncbi:hypothetical protein SCHPADRAFT_817371 [Schizopora paradoxa]|uniref:Long chronological lifespan protein 2 n=1 Tax=Schizopora paradoxa TaxID=27342 RepID=A0A0H2S6J0_9AGAM|nr:hypothetical protein SCHPADRAFT_817371 [Schizopora paradoxa]